jgi:sigma-B regulation protein RsbU (phosphoserine phosphatase)
LGVGDLLFIYTDGVTEAMDPGRELYGEERLVDLLGSRRFSDPAETIEATITDIRAFASGAEQSDDITMLALDFRRSSAMDKTRGFKTKMRNDLGAVGEVLHEFQGLAEKSGIPDQARKQVKVAFDELLNNIVSYGFPDSGEHEIHVAVELLDERLMITITDDGVPFNPFQKETPDLESSLEDREIGGLGIHLVRNLMDEVSYKRGVDKNVVTLIKKLGEE